MKIHELKILPDERGFFAQALRQDWKELLGEEWITQVNISYSYPDMVRAWHRHMQGQIDFFLVLKGSMKICAYEVETGKISEIIASAKKPVLVRIPGRYLHGTKTVGNEPSLTVYCVTKLYDYKNPDEIRIPWNAKLTPTEINGDKDDPRVGKPWDWFRPPHK